MQTRFLEIDDLIPLMGGCMDIVGRDIANVKVRDGRVQSSEEGSYLRLIDLCITRR